MVELSSLEHLKGIAINVEHSIRLNLSMSALYKRLLGKSNLLLSKFLLIKALDFFLPFLLNDLDHVALILGLKDRKFYFYGAFFVGWDIILGC